MSEVVLKESEELLDGVALVVAELVKDLKDGLQAGKDAAALVGFLLGNQEKLTIAVDGALKALPELKAASLSQKIEFGVKVVNKSAALLESKPEIVKHLELIVKLALVVADHFKVEA